MAVSMDDDVPLILTLDDSGSSTSAPLDAMDREELPNERACSAALNGNVGVPAVSFRMPCVSSQLVLLFLPPPPPFSSPLSLFRERLG